MKILKFKLILALLSLGVMSCNDAEYGVIDNGLYIAQAADMNVTKLNLNSAGATELAINAQVIRALESDVQVEVSFDAAALKEYNENNDTFYEVLPMENLTYDKSAKIMAGEHVTSDIVFTISEYDTPNGESYALPIRISTPSTQVAPLGSSQLYIVLLNKALIQAVPRMNNSNKATPVDPDALWGLSEAEWTIEGWVNMSGFQINNQAIWNSGSWENSPNNEMYIRFGDAPIPYNSFQVKAKGSQVNTVTLFQPNRWYHIAITCNTAGLVSIYVDGNLDVSVQTQGGPTLIDRFEMVTSGSWFRDRVMMGQVKFWRVALSQSQLQANMYSSARSSDPALIAYWKLDEGEGNTFKDSSTNERDLVSAGTLEWIPDVDFK